MTVTAGTAATPDEVMSRQTAALLYNDEVICHGVVSDRYIITADHCLKDLVSRRPKGRLEARIGPDGPHVPLSFGQLLNLFTAQYAYAQRSFYYDYAVIPLDHPPVPAKAIPVLALTDRARPSESVTVFAADDEQRVCQVQRLCGGELSYTCGKQTVKGMSGSGVWARRPGGAVLVGIHTRNESPSFFAADAGTVLGHSSFLFPSPNQFSQTFAGASRYRYTPGSTCRPLEPFEVEPVDAAAIGEPTGRFRALLADGSNLLTAADGRRACTFRIDAAVHLTGCIPLSRTASARIAALTRLTDGTVAIGLTQGASYIEPDDERDDLADGTVVVADWDRSTGAVGAHAWRSVAVPIGSVRAMTAVGIDVVVGGERGLCVVRGGACPALPETWRVNGVLRLSDTAFIAVGGAHESGGVEPRCGWFAREADGRWRQTASCPADDALRRTVAGLKSHGRALTFSAPILLDGHVVAFSSDGQAYRLEPGQRPEPVAIAFLKAGQRYPGSTQFDDGVRDATTIGADLFALAGNDGGLHFVQQIGAPARLTEYMLPNLAMRMTAVAASRDWLAAIASDGSLSIVRWHGDLAQRIHAVTGAKDGG